MTDLKSAAWLRVGARAQYVPAPAQGLAMSPLNWGATTQLVNGSNATVASEYATRQFDLSWSVLSEQDLWTLQDLLAYAGTREVYYLDLFAARGNVLSPLAGNPALLVETLSPVAVDASGKVLARAENDGLVFSGAAATDGQAHQYTEMVQVPEGYRATAVAWGVSTQRVVTFNGVALQPGTATSVASPATQQVPLVISAPSNAATLTGVSVRLTPLTEPAPVVEWTPPLGTGVMRVVPGTFTVTGRNAYNGLYSATVSIQEVWPWL